MRYYLIAVTVVFASQTAFGGNDSWSWVQASKGKDSNSIVWTLKESHFLETELPLYQEDFGFQKKHKKTKLSEALLTTFGGPPDESISPDKHSIVLTACRAQSCDEKGFFWANDKDKTSAMAMVHYVYQGKFDSSPQLFLASKNFKCGEYPEAVMTQVKAWLNSKKIKVQKVRCLQGETVQEIAI